MCTLNTDDIHLFSICFNVYNQKPHYLELKSNSGQHWCVYKEDEDIIILLHKHHFKDKYHVHFVFDGNAGKALSEILQHEKYIEKRNRQQEKICGDRQIEIIL